MSSREAELSPRRELTTVSVTPYAGVDVVSVDGEFDLVYESSLRYLVSDPTRVTQSQVIVDLSGVSFMDASGADAIVSTANASSPPARQSCPSCARQDKRHASWACCVFSTSCRSTRTERAPCSGSLTVGSSPTARGIEGWSARRSAGPASPWVAVPRGGPHPLGMGLRASARGTPLPAARSADVAVICLVRVVLRDAERKAGAVPQHVPATVASTHVNGTVTDETPNVCVLVIGAVVEVGTHRTLGLVEPLEEQLKGRPGVIVPLAGELVGGGAHPPTGEQRLPELDLGMVPVAG